ncbi:hypothetical protein Anas_07104 [Armadillidium nasatum]|uniref:Helicase ATP-binding domain-containing protein n=1 Tax=Armadillidium nasatum TaxID=96803 RepID=A0A5N5TJA7_9CRUS|nr:hypothetical protein Anas_07104 [Armadillidium nasatum]
MERRSSSTSIYDLLQKKIAKCENTLGKFEKYLQDQINKQKYHNTEISSKSGNSVRNSQYGVPKKSKANLREFNSDEIKDDKSGKLKTKNPLKSRILHPKRHWKEKNLGSITSEIESDLHKAAPKTLLSEKTAFVTSENEEMLSGSEYIPSGDENVSEEEMETKKNCITSKKNNVPSKKRREKNGKKSKRVIDDSYLENYIKRIQKWKKERLKEKHRKILSGEDFDSDEDEEFERFEGNYKIPLSIWNKLFKYQRVCVKWLWELHCQQCGGILGDEMGLGKTVMVISFLVGLSYSGLFDHNRGRKGLGPVLIVSPATVLQQWVKEFQQWWPPFRVAILHDSGGFRGKKSALIHNINEHDGILISSYRGIVDHLKVLLNYDWHYIILDEGHKIRNPEAQITVAVKRFQTPHKLILSAHVGASPIRSSFSSDPLSTNLTLHILFHFHISQVCGNACFHLKGSPIQNGLKELWSLFDFIFPGKLGTLSVFLQQFAVPITQGGYANASKLEVKVY